MTALQNERYLVFYDDARARTFEPFALSRPLCEMRVGAVLMRERWEMALRGTSARFVGAPHLTGFVEEDAPRFEQSVIPAGTVLVNSRAAIALAHAALTEMHARDKKAFVPNRTWYVNGALAAVELEHELDVSVLRDGSASLDDIVKLQMRADATAANTQQSEIAAKHALDGRVDVPGVWLQEVWDVIRHLTPLLNEDIPALAAHLKLGKFTSNEPFTTFGTVSGHPVYVEAGAIVEPRTYFDTSLGPVLLRAGASVQAFTRVVGPCYIGRNSTVMGDRISGSAIGDTCRVHGELSATVFLGFSNKGHDGFVGHSIVGRWVNMGAGTITSNLKNTYGTVALWTPSGVRDTGLQFLGTLFGDHVKTGIGMRLTTGCVLGMAANVFDSMTPKVVEPFAWGSSAPYDTYAVDKFIETAARMMSRRHVELNAEGQAMLRAAHAARWRTS